jgi:hypothetical protein
VLYGPSQRNWELCRRDRFAIVNCPTLRRCLRSNNGLFRGQIASEFSVNLSRVGQLAPLCAASLGPADKGGGAGGWSCPKSLVKEEAVENPAHFSNGEKEICLWSGERTTCSLKDMQVYILVVVHGGWGRRVELQGCSRWTDCRPTSGPARKDFKQGRPRERKPHRSH